MTFCLLVYVSNVYVHVVV